jgi:S-formylglutathione hydrolase FrmB
MNSIAYVSRTICGVAVLVPGLAACAATPPCDLTKSNAEWLESFSYLNSGPVDIAYWDRPEGSTADAFALGAVETTFESQLLNRDVNYLIWLPPSYGTDPERDYPVVFYLPGANGQPWQVGAFLQHLDTAIEMALAPEMIVVGVNAIADPSYYVDAAGGELPLESMIVRELIPHIDTTYRTHPQPRYRAIEGYSTGGYGALHLALAYPGTFTAATSLAGFVFSPERAEASSEGSLICDVWRYWLEADSEYIRENDVLSQIEMASSETLASLSIRLGYGDEDPLSFVQASAEQMRDLLEERGYPPTDFIEGVHVWHSDVRMYDWLGPEGFAFYGSLFP